MQLQDTRSDKIFGACVVIVMVLVLAIIIYPVLIVISSSFSNPVAVANGRVRLLPVGFTFNSYKMVFSDSTLLQGYKNTILYTLVGTSLNILVTTMAAYALARREFFLRGPVMFLFVFTMYFNGGTIPTYLIIKELGLINSFWAMIFPGALSVYNMIVMRTFFRNSIPVELYEVASIDGASYIRMLLSIALPLSKSIIAVMVLFYGVSHWNSFYDALLYLHDSRQHPLQLVLREILMQAFSVSEMVENYATAEQLLATESLKYAIIIVSSLPVLAAYPFLQKYFVKGVMVGAIKG